MAHPKMGTVRTWDVVPPSVTRVLESQWIALTERFFNPSRRASSRRRNGRLSANNDCCQEGEEGVVVVSGAGDEAVLLMACANLMRELSTFSAGDLVSRNGNPRGSVWNSTSNGGDC